MLRGNYEAGAFFPVAEVPTDCGDAGCGFIGRYDGVVDARGRASGGV